MSKSTCLICPKKHHCRGYCQMHYTRFKRHGDPNVVKRVDFVSETCTLDGCDRPYDARGYCSMHYIRWAKHGDVEFTSPRGGKARWTRNVGYGVAHERVAEARGKASSHRCAHCTKQAIQWAYDHEDPDPLILKGSGTHYSGDPEHYIPLCSSCHKLFDLA